MASRTITIYQVRNGNCCLMKLDDQVLVFDLHGTDEKSSYELLSPEFREEDGVKILDVLCVSHGDEDHCLGFRTFKDKIESGDLKIGTIWHSGHDRREHEKKKDLPDDYLALQDEIDRRNGVDDPEFGDLEIALKNGDDESVAFEEMAEPTSFELTTLHPYAADEDEDTTAPDVNETSLVLRIKVSGVSLLFAGDAGSESWQERIIPLTLEKADTETWAEADILVVSHHGSFGFFGTDREAVRDADPQPDNYEALDYVSPDELVVSAKSRFPTSSDSSGDDPPHYAAWKWYHKWFRDERDVEAEDKHPAAFHYTYDGHVRLELDGDVWSWIDDWTPDDSDDDGDDEADDRSSSTPQVRFKRNDGETKRERDHFA